MPAEEQWTLGRRPALDGLRGIAVMLVIGAHIKLFPDAAGGVGVTAFFVLSGFLIATLLLQELELRGRVDLRRFFERRARRLLPALYSVIAVCGVFALAGVPLVTLREVVGAATYSANLIGPVVQTGAYPPALHHTWSLVMEEQFYLLFPAVLLVLWRRPRLFALVLSTGITFAAVERFRLYGAVSLDRVVFGTHTRLDGILVGCLLALALRGRHVAVSRWAARAALLALGVAVVLPPSTAFLWGLLLVDFATAALIVAVLAEQQPRYLERDWLTYVGRRSYGLYLWHHVLLVALMHTALIEHPAFLGGVVVFGSVCIAEASWRWIESPFMRRGRRAPVAVAPVPSPSLGGA